MERQHSHCAGIDVHKRTAVVTMTWLDGNGERHQRTCTFATFTPDLRRLRDWLTAHQVTHVAIESTGVYWKPVFNVLEAAGISVILANARHVKAVPGRKTDVRDSEWLLELLQHGLIQGSFIPDAPIRALRDLTRYRTSLLQERTRTTNRILKLLEEANLKLASVVSDVQGVSGRAILAALVAGETNPEVLADLARGRLRRKRDQLVVALDGQLLDHQRVMLSMLLRQIDQLNETIEALSRETTQRLAPYATAVDLLTSIVGIKGRVAEVVIAEIGVEMTRFASARHLCSWAGVCPGNDESAGKRRSGRTRPGNAALQTALVQAAWAAIKVKDSYFGAQFRRIAKRRGDQRAIVAVAHSLLTVIYHVLHEGKPYADLGANYFDRLQPDRHTRYHVRRLTELGYTVTLEPAAVA